MSDEIANLHARLFAEHMPYTNVYIFEAVSIPNPWAWLIKEKTNFILNINFTLMKTFYAIHALKTPLPSNIMKNNVDINDIPKTQNIQGKIFALSHFININKIKNAEYQRILQQNKYYGMYLCIYYSVYVHMLDDLLVY